MIFLSYHNISGKTLFHVYMVALSRYSQNVTHICDNALKTLKSRVVMMQSDFFFFFSSQNLTKSKTFSSPCFPMSGMHSSASQGAELSPLIVTVRGTFQVKMMICLTMSPTIDMPTSGSHWAEIFPLVCALQIDAVSESTQL